MISATVCRILLVGFMGSGKSSVGRVLAAALGWRFIDADQTLEDDLDTPIAALFQEHGEAFFREKERTTMAALLDEEGVVIATGGGWAAQPQWVDGLPPGTGTVWLQVTAVEAVGRVQAEPGKRPLLDSDEPVDTARKLVESRSPSYALAEWEADTEGRSVEDVAARILEMFSGNDLILDAE